MFGFLQTWVMRTNDRTQTFLQVVLKIVKKNRPEALQLREEMASLSKNQSCKFNSSLTVQRAIKCENCTSFEHETFFGAVSSASNLELSKS